MQSTKKEKQLIIKSSEVGEKYLEVLKKAINVRAERRKIYGDDFSHPIDVEVWTIYQKTFRMIKLYRDGNSNYEKIDDTLIDLINYALFLLIKLDMQKNERKK